MPRVSEVSTGSHSIFMLDGCTRPSALMPLLSCDRVNRGPWPKLSDSDEMKSVLSQSSTSRVGALCLARVFASGKEAENVGLIPRPRLFEFKRSRTIAVSDPAGRHTVQVGGNDTPIGASNENERSPDDSEKSASSAGSQMSPLPVLTRANAERFPRFMSPGTPGARIFRSRSCSGSEHFPAETASNMSSFPRESSTGSTAFEQAPGTDSSERRSGRRRIQHRRAESIPGIFEQGRCLLVLPRSPTSSVLRRGVSSPERAFPSFSTLGSARESPNG